jgi:hypothetical protein
VAVSFDLFKPGVERQVTLGFVSPPAMRHDASEPDEPSTNIKSFKVALNGQELSYSVTQYSGKKNPASSYVAPRDFVYLFKALILPLDTFVSPVHLRLLSRLQLAAMAG